MTNILSFNFKQIICVCPIMHHGYSQYMDISALLPVVQIASLHGWY